MPLIRAIYNWIAYVLSWCVPKDRRLIAFGSWGGAMFSDNPKYFLLYILGNTNFRVVWVGRRYMREMLPSHPRLRFVEKDSLLSLKYLIRARMWVYDHNSEDLCKLDIFGGTVLLNLWHGIPLKYMGRKTTVALREFGTKDMMWKMFAPLGRAILYRPRHEWTAVSSPKMGEILCDCYPLLFSKERLLYCGLPRNDFIIANAGNVELIRDLKKKYADLLGFNPDRKVVLYMPTWRMTKTDIFTFFGLDAGRSRAWKDFLAQKGAVLIEKHHFNVLRVHNLESHIDSCSIVVPNSMQQILDTQELLLMADILVTDYSSAYVDFVLLGRPCVHFAYDLDSYLTADSGMAYDYKEVLGGPCVKTEEELMRVLGLNLDEPKAEPASGFSSLVVYEKGHSSQTIRERLLPVPTKRT